MNRRTFFEGIRYLFYFFLVILGILLSEVPQAVGGIFLLEVLRTTISVRKNFWIAMIRTIYFLVLLAGTAILFNMVAAAFYVFLSVDLNTYEFLSYAAVSLAFPVSALLYLRFVEHEDGNVFSRLGLGRKSLTLKNLSLGIYLFLLVFLMEIIAQLISAVTGVQINTNINNVLGGAPLWFYLFAALISPINEEMLFRGLLVSKIGVIGSAALFATLHYTYGSTYGIEVIAALVFGLLAGYVYKKTNSLYPSVLTHMITNTLAVASTFAFTI